MKFSPEFVLTTPTLHFAIFSSARVLARYGSQTANKARKQ